MLTVGIDPDLHDVSIGWWLDGKPAHAEVIHVPHTKTTRQPAVLKMVEALMAWKCQQVHVEKVAVEAQELVRHGIKEHKRPEDIVLLGNVAGACLAFARNCFPCATLLFPTPTQWKGQIPKHVHQARLYNELGWGYEIVGKPTVCAGKINGYARPKTVPANFTHVTEGQWKHVGDALLLARWASEQR